MTSTTDIGGQSDAGAWSDRTTGSVSGLCAEGRARARRLVRRGRRVPRGRNTRPCQEPGRNQPVVHDEPAFRLGGSDHEPVVVQRRWDWGSRSPRSCPLARKAGSAHGSSALPRSCRCSCVAGPEIYAWAWLIVAWGIAVRLVPVFERSAIRPRPVAHLESSRPGRLRRGCGRIRLRDGVAQAVARERSSLASGGAPNVLLVVLDTVRADRLSLYGYPRPTSRTLEKLARQGIRFDEARATAPWTLASHASMFTGRWPSELDVRWLTPLRGRFPTVAEYLGSHGFATAGFAANTGYCSYDTGLDRGFTHFEDYDLNFHRRTSGEWRRWSSTAASNLPSSVCG